MGCDIHMVYQRKINNQWEDVEPPTECQFGDPFDNRNYALFGLLADVRNYSELTPISQPRGFPDDFDAGCCFYDPGNDHSATWLSIEEITAIDPEARIFDQREEESTTLGTLLGPDVFERIRELRTAGVERLVFFFDS